MGFIQHDCWVTQELSTVLGMRISALNKRKQWAYVGKEWNKWVTFIDSIIFWAVPSAILSP